MIDTDIQKLAEYESIIRMLTTKLEEAVGEIDRLRGEVARLTEGAGALATLQSLYRDPALPESLRAKCAIGCLVHESPRLLPERQLEVKADDEPPETLPDRVTRQRARMDQLLALPLEERSEMFSPSRSDSGNGDDRDGA